MEGALELLDSKMVAEVLSKPSERKFFQFTSQLDNEPTFCFEHYCPCPAFKIAVVSKENTLAVCEICNRIRNINDN